MIRRARIALVSGVFFALVGLLSWQASSALIVFTVVGFAVGWTLARRS